MESKRIEYIDLMKGICIVLIILLHCGITFQNERLDNMFRDFRIPLYFFLSGLFFKEYGGFGDFCIKKINKLLIPYIFFVCITVVFWISHCFNVIDFIYYLLIKPYNYPLWFLQCLFFTYILYYIYYKFVGKRNWKLQTVVMVGVTFPLWMVVQNLSSPNCEYLLMIYPMIQNVLTAVVAIPFFLIASTLRKKGLLVKQIKGQYIIVLFSLFFVIWFFTCQGNVEYMVSRLGNNYLFLYTSALGGIGCVWCIAYTLKHLFYFSYVGRYSLIALGTHIPFMIFFNKCFGIENKYIMVLCVLAIMPGVIWFFKKYFPYFTAQKDLLVYDNGSVKWAWTKRL